MRAGDIFRRRAPLVAIFPTHRALGEALDHVLDLGLGDVLDIGHAALIACDERGEVQTVNNNVTPREGLYSGMTLGATIAGLVMLQLGALELPKVAGIAALALSLLLGAGIGGALGQMVAALVGFGFDPDLLRSIERRLQPGQVALLLQVRPRHIPLLRRELNALEPPAALREHDGDPPVRL